MPLLFAPRGQGVVIRKIGGSLQQRRHLAELGFAEGEQVAVVSCLSGNVIVRVRQGRVALGRQLAQKILI